MLSEKQIQLRKSGIGASEATAVLGLCKYRTPLDVYNEKVFGSSFEGNEKTEWGSLFEDVIAKRASEIYELDIINTGKTYRHKEHPFILATPDRLIKGTREGVEIKNRSSWMINQYGDEDTDDVLTSDLIQCQQNMLVTDREKWHLFVLFGGNMLKRFTIIRNEKLIGKIIDRESIFWLDHVEKSIPPDPINSQDLDAISSEVINGKSITADKSTVNMVNDLKIVKNKIKELKKYQDSLEFNIKSTMATGEILVDNIGDKLVTWKSQTSNRLDQSKLKSEKPEIYEQYVQTSTSRVFRTL